MVMTKNFSHGQDRLYAAVMSSLIPLLALLSIGGWPATFPHLRIGLAIDARLPPALARDGVAEAAAIWAPYGVAIMTADSSSAPHGWPGRVPDAVLTVMVAEPRVEPARVWSSPFASIRFSADAVPEPTILLHYDMVTTLGLRTVSVGGKRESQWPSAVRDRVLSRIIGRVVAHEIGHWLLRSRDHSTSGLMRAYQTTDELANPARAGFTLPAADFARLRAALTQ
jgi:hypothetical protein